VERGDGLGRVPVPAVAHAPSGMSQNCDPDGQPVQGPGIIEVECECSGAPDGRAGVPFSEVAAEGREQQPHTGAL
jgi:hypothetical protein